MIYDRASEESFEEYKKRLFTHKDEYNISWKVIAELLNKEGRTNYSISKFKKEYQRGYAASSCIDMTSELRGILFELRKERVKLTDERVQINADVRKISREETIKEIANTLATSMNQQKMLDASCFMTNHAGNEAILLLSDWHYGIECDNYWNVYNPDICKTRLSQLRDSVLSKCAVNNITRIHVLNLADLICGRIHLSLRLQSRIDVMTQIFDVSELMAELLTDFAKVMDVEYYDCLDNHSRLEPNKNDALDLETLARVTPWYLRARKLSPNIRIHDNVFDEGIITFECKGHKVLGVHGDRDKQNRAIENLSLMTKTHYDLVCTAHMHHFSADERNETLLISNGSLMGTDTYAKNLRLTSKPSQTLIIATDDCVADAVYRIVLK